MVFDFKTLIYTYKKVYEKAKNKNQFQYQYR